jgi:hypothetical protein
MGWSALAAPVRLGPMYRGMLLLPTGISRYDYRHAQ